jgi:exodeoxyribonuclease VII large subunit
VYEPRGQYQLIVDAAEPQGLGALQLAFERLKQKLQAEGLGSEGNHALIKALERLSGITVGQKS